MDQASSETPIVFGKYQLLSRLARGGMAEVFKAKSHGVEGFEKVLVIKRILPELGQNPRFVEMFINEAKIAVTLSHANIVQVFDLGRAEGAYFIAMEYVAGYDLMTILRRARRFGRPLSSELVAYVGSEVAKALDYAHRRRDSNRQPLHIVHRDVSPHNVLISFEGEVKLTDFGIAKAVTTVESEEEAKILKGKYAYMSPEQARGGHGVDARSDIFSLGLVLFEALSGQNPYESDSPYDMLKAAQAGDVPPLLDLASGVPAELAEIVDRALYADPDARYPNAGHIYEELMHFLFSTEGRASGHDLADYMHELRELSEAAAAEGISGSHLKAAFEREASGAPPLGDRTPSDLGYSAPDDREGARAGIDHTVSESLPIGGVRPLAERRDVSAVAFRVAAGHEVPAELLGSLFSRFGGARFEAAGGDAADAAQGAGLSPIGAQGAVTVLFGVREPDGNDARSAARFARRLTRELADQPELALTIGIEAGRILIGEDGTVVRDEGLKALLRSASALASEASPGSVRLSSEAYGAIERSFHAEPAPGAIGVGSTGRGAVFVLGKERQDPAALDKFVGRRDELRRVGEALALTIRGQVRIVGLSGEAGLGKSRLIYEIRHRLKANRRDVGFYLASCERQGAKVALSGVQEMLRAILGIEELDPEDVVREKIGRLRQLGLAAPDIAAISVALGFHDLSDAAGAGVQHLRTALARVALKLAEDRLTVFAWDSAETMDEGSLTVLSGFLEELGEARVALLFAARPGFYPPWVGHPRYTEIALGPLTGEEIVELSALRLGTDEVPAELLLEVRAKAAGNPLYVEEYIKALTDAGAVLRMREGQIMYRPDVAEVEVPKTLRGIVSSRLSRLSPTDRYVLQVASVIGDRFSVELLGEVSAQPPGVLAEALDLFARQGWVAPVGAAEHAFAHALVADVIRSGLTLESRRELHAAVAEALERLHVDRRAELAERLARHHREAGARDRAVDYLVLAADRLEGEYSHQAANAHLSEALELLRAMPAPDHERIFALYQRIGLLSFRSRDLARGAERMLAAIELAEALGRDEQVARLSVLRGRLLVNGYEHNVEGQRWLDRAAALARRLDDRALLRDVALAIGEAHMRNGEHRQAIGHFEEALALSDEDAIEAQIRCLIPLALAAASSGELARALQALERAQQLGGENPEPFNVCERLKIESLVRFYARDYRGSIEVAERARELGKEFGFVYEAAVNAHNMGEAYLHLADDKRAFASLRYSYETAREHGFESLKWANLRLLGFIDATRFGSEQGRAHVVTANEWAQQNGYPWDLVQGLYYLAMIDQQRDEAEAARASLQEVLRLAADYGHQSYVTAAEAALRALDRGSTIQLPG